MCVSVLHISGMYVYICCESPSRTQLLASEDKHNVRFYDEDSEVEKSWSPIRRLYESISKVYKAAKPNQLINDDTITSLFKADLEMLAKKDATHQVNGKTLAKGFNKTKEELPKGEQPSFCQSPCEVDGVAFSLKAMMQMSVMVLSLVAVLMNFPVSQTKVFGCSEAHPNKDDNCFTGRVYRGLTQFMPGCLFMTDILPKAAPAKDGSPKAKHKPAMRQQVCVCLCGCVYVGGADAAGTAWGDVL